MKYSQYILLLLCIFVLNACGQAPWHTMLGDSSRRSYSKWVAGPLGAEQQTKLWTLEGSQNMYYGVALAGVNNIAYYVVQDAFNSLPYGLTLVAVDIDAGTQLWNHSRPSSLPTPSGLLYLYASIHPTLPLACAVYYSTDNTLTPFVECYTAQTGALSFNVSLSPLLNGSSSPLRVMMEFVSEESILITNQQVTNDFDTYISLNSTNGATLWTVQDLFATYNPSSFWDSPTVYTLDHSNLYFNNRSQSATTWGMTAFSFNPANPTSQLLWTFSAPAGLSPLGASQTPMQPMSAHDDLVIWGLSRSDENGNYSYIYGLGANNGSLLWTISVPQSLFGFALSPNNTLVVSTVSSLLIKNPTASLLAYNISQPNNLLWQVDISGNASYYSYSVVPPSIDSSGIVYVCNGSLLGFDATTGKLVFQHYSVPCLQQPIVASSSKVLFNVPTPPTMVAVGKPASPPSPPAGGGSDLKKYWWAFLIGAVGLAAVIIIVVIVTMKRKRVTYEPVHS